MENAEGTVTIRMKGLNKGEPVTFKYPFWKTPITFDARGVAEVPLAVSKRLLGPDFEGIYEVFKQAQIEPLAQKSATKVQRQNKSATAIEEPEGAGDVKEFLTKM